MNATNLKVADDRTARRKAIFAGAAGNFVEWFDWSIYGYFAVYFSGQFFAGEDETTALLAAFLVFGLGFFFRPLGGAVLGAYADRHGRKAGMALTILLMAGASFVIGILPTWEKVGIVAPALLVLARLVQGFSAGGEFGTSSAFLVEKATSGTRAFVGSWQQVSVGLGVLGASATAWILFRLLSEAQLEAWGWRVPFILGGVLGAIGLWLRLAVEDTDAFKNLQKQGKVARRPLVEVVRKYPVQCLRVVGIVAAGSVTYYLWLIYLPTYANLQAGADLDDGQLATTLTLLVFVCLLPFSGRLADRVGRRPMLLVFALGSMLAIPFLLAGIGASFTSVLLVGVVGAALLALYSGCVAAVMAEQFPAEVRTVGISLPYGVAVAIFGGLTPYIATYLMDGGHTLTFSLYASAVCALSAVTYYLMRETKDEELA